MGLREIEYAEEYRSGEDDALTSFFLPSFRAARTYDRAVGYFSSSALESFAEPFERFVQFGGTVRLVASVEVHRDDLEAIERQAGREAACEARILEIIDQEFSGKTLSTGVQKLAALLEMGRLEIRIAVPKTGRGIYHEKVGIFDGDETDYVAFAGSTNESRQALEFNYECIDVFPSWQSPSRALNKKKHFEALWESRAPGATTYTFSDAAKRKLIRAVLHEPTGPGGSGKSEEAGLCLTREQHCRNSLASSAASSRWPRARARRALRWPFSDISSAMGRFGPPSLPQMAATCSISGLLTSRPVCRRALRAFGC